MLYQGTSSHLCSTILDVISSIYHQDSANYFILEPQNTLAQFAEKLHLKPEDIQVGTVFFTSSMTEVIVVPFSMWASVVEIRLVNIPQTKPMVRFSPHFQDM